MGVANQNPLTPLQDKVLEIIKTKTKDYPITGKNILRQVQMEGESLEKQGANLRSVINTLRDKGNPICAGSRGYYYPRSRTELKEYIDDFENRILQQKTALNTLKYIWEQAEKKAVDK